MKKLLLMIAGCVMLACGDGRNRDEAQDKREAAAEEEVDPGAGEEISPQLELDSTESRFEVDTISSPEEAREEAEDESF